MYFGGGSYISVYSDAEISFTHNYANHTGGGIKVDKYYAANIGVTDCFLQQVGNNAKFIFDGNKAQDGGDAIWRTEVFKPTERCDECGQ